MTMREIDVERLQEIQAEIKSLLEESEEIVRSSTDMVYQRAKGHWIAQIETALSNDHRFLGNCMCSMQSTINELKPFVEPEEVWEDECQD
jgi:ElaB/YqjD/DUF883 family membrane-anchored ribosome-binding protein